MGRGSVRMGRERFGVRDAQTHFWYAISSRRLALAIAGASIAMACAVLAGGASASEHIVVTGEYGKEGPPSSGVGNGCRIAYQGETQRLYLLSDTKVYGLSISPGSATPLGGSYPLAGVNSSCGDPDIEVDNTGGPSKGNIYAVPSSHLIYGWDPTGTPLAPPWAVDAGGETCGVAVTGSGEVWGGNYGNEVISKFTQSGSANGVIPLGFRACKFVVDPVTNDLFVAPFSSSEPLLEYTAASGYTTTIDFPSAGIGNAGLAINGAEHKLYVGNGGNEVKAYDTTNGALIETIDIGGSGGLGIAVDEGTDTLFVTVGSGESGVIKEYLGVTTPTATTGEPIGNSEVSGTADPNGVGPITECYFEFGISPLYGSKQDCAEAMPINSVQSVHASLPGLIGEETYHYRLVLGTGVQFVIGRGGDKTIIPHNVKGLHTDAATDVTQESATLNAHFEGTGEDTHYYFEWGHTKAYGKRTALPPGEDAGTTIGVTNLSAQLADLEPGVTYHYRVVAENSIGVSKANDQEFKTFELPAIESFRSSHVTASSADIEARINPKEFETRYHVEYGPTMDYGSIQPIPDATLPAGNATEGVSVHLEGLEGITYHFRVVAENQWGTTATGDQTFNFFPPTCPNATLRQQTGSDFLPDCRAYELVSPSETGNVVLTAPVPAPPATDAIGPARFAFAGFWGAISGFDTLNNSFDVYVSTRTSQGWVTKYVGIRGFEAMSASIPIGSNDLSKFLDFMGGFTGPSSPIPFAWDFENNPLGRWPAPPDEIPGGDGEHQIGNFQTSPDFSHMAFSSNNIDFDPEGHGVTVAPGSAYDFDTSKHSITLISQTAAGEDIPQEPGNLSSTDEAIKFLPPIPGFRGEIQSNPSLSTDGSHIVMSTTSSPGSLRGRLYMRVDDAITYEVSQGQPVEYVGMTRDGSKVFFSSFEQLTPDDTDSSTDLYMWSEATDAIERITTGREGAGNSDSCIAAWTAKCNAVAVKGEAETDNAIAADTGNVYFYSPELLDGSENGLEGAQNLYVYREGSVHFVLTLQSDGSRPITRMQVSPDGKHAAFVTTSDLTSYDSAGHKEMYTYEPPRKGITCVSCNPSGAAATTDLEASMNGLFMSDDGRTFWATSEALVPQDTDNIRDVYEFAENRPQLISSGTGEHDGRGPERRLRSGFSGVSADGVNAYFSTYDTLVAQDHNGPFLKFYDARVGGGIPAPTAQTPCIAADECHGPTAGAPIQSQIVSEGALGSGGNVVNKKKQKRRANRARRARKRRQARRRRHSKRIARQRNA
jgi:hypothetical protein